MIVKLMFTFALLLTFSCATMGEAHENEKLLHDISQETFCIESNLRIVERYEYRATVDACGVPYVCYYSRVEKSWDCDKVELKKRWW